MNDKTIRKDHIKEEVIGTSKRVLLYFFFVNLDYSLIYSVPNVLFSLPCFGKPLSDMELVK